MSNHQLKVYYIDSSISSNKEIKFFETAKSAWLALAKQFDARPYDKANNLLGFIYGDVLKFINTNTSYIKSFWGKTKRVERTFTFNNYLYDNYTSLFRAMAEWEFKNNKLSSIETLVATYTIKELVLGSPFVIQIPAPEESWNRPCTIPDINLPDEGPRFRCNGDLVFPPSEELSDLADSTRRLVALELERNLEKKSKPTKEEWQATVKFKRQKRKKNNARKD